MEPGKSENDALAYQQLVAVTSEFWTWRFRGFTILGILSTAIVTVAGSLEIELLAFPGFVGAALYLGLLLIDVRTTAILHDCYATGRVLEDPLESPGAFGTRAFCDPPPLASYGNVMKGACIVGVLACLTLAGFGICG